MTTPSILFILGIIVVSTESQNVLQDFSVGNKIFAANVYKELLQSNSGDFLACPLSAEIILTLVHSGAGGKTAQELSSGLHLPKSQAQIQRTIQALRPLLEGNDKYALNSANIIYIKNGFKVHNQFKSIALNAFKSDIQPINFENNIQAAAEINNYVSKKTHKNIQGLVDPNDFDADTRAVLVNAMYFHGKWVNAFPTRATRELSFYTTLRDFRPVTMMQQVNYLRYYESEQLQAQFVELPYEGDDVTMTIVLPKSKDGLAALETQIGEVLAPKKFEAQLVEVALPKFETKTTIEYKPILEKLGIIEAFSDVADFSGILDGENLKISKVIQKTAIEVEEEGTIASAATVVELPVPISIDYEPPKVIEFTADHPFIYFIKIKDIIFFVGRYTGV